MKTVTETDIIVAGISDDFDPVHINEEYAKNHFSAAELPIVF
jgi:acyl dehydratase